MFLGNTKKSNLVSINRNYVFYFIWIRFCQEFIEELGGAQKKRILLQLNWFQHTIRNAY